MTGRCRVLSSFWDLTLFVVCRARKNPRKNVGVTLVDGDVSVHASLLGFRVFRCIGLRVYAAGGAEVQYRL